MKLDLRPVILRTLDTFGINALLRYINRNKALILWYHGICNDDFTLLKGYDERHIPRSLFEQQLQFLKKKGYTFATLSELTDILQHNKPCKKIVTLTFDDGFRNVITNAYPLMRQSHAKGCFYLVTSLIGKKELLWTDHVETVIRHTTQGPFQFSYQGKTITYHLDTKESYQRTMKDVKRKLRALSNAERKEHMHQFQNIKINQTPEEFRFANWEEIKTVDPTILEVGSHTKTHPNCANLSIEDEFQEEIRDSKKHIEQKTGLTIQHFCYPGGAYNNTVIQYVKKSGYKSAVTIHSGFNDSSTDPFKLKRILVNGNMLMFKADVSGSILLINKLRKIIPRKKTG